MPRRISHKNSTARMVIICGCCVLIFAFLLMFFAISRRANLLAERSFYLVYIESSRDVRALETEADIIKFFGGAGRIYKFQDKHYILTSVYFDQGEASEVANNLKKTFTSAGIIDIHTPVISHKIRQKIGSEHLLKEYFEKFSEFMEELHGKSMNFAKGELSEGDFCQDLVKWRLKFINLKDELAEIAENSGLNQQIYESCERLTALIDSFFDNFYGSRIKTSLVYRISIDMALEYHEIMNNL